MSNWIVIEIARALGIQVEDAVSVRAIPTGVKKPTLRELPISKQPHNTFTPSPDIVAGAEAIPAQDEITPKQAAAMAKFAKIGRADRLEKQAKNGRKQA